jgi:transposase
MPAPRKYPDELRERAIRLVLDIEEETGNTTAARRRIAGEPGINSDTLRGWVKRAQIDSGKRPGTTTADAARIRQLERENAELRAARVRRGRRTRTTIPADRGAWPPDLVNRDFHAAAGCDHVGPVVRGDRIPEELADAWTGVAAGHAQRSVVFGLPTARRHGNA